MKKTTLSGGNLIHRTQKLMRLGLMMAMTLTGASGIMAQVTVFSESMGNVGSTTTIAAHESANGFDNDAYTMSGTADLRNTLASSGYGTASGGANVFITNTAGRNFQIEGINTIGLAPMTLSFGIHKSTTSGTGSDLIVEVSTDGISYSSLSYPALPSGSGTATWHYRTATTAIPATANLRIRFRASGSTTQYRIDDVLLTSTACTPATITASGPLTFCEGGSVTLTATSGSSYLWSNGETSQSISVSTSGSYSVAVSGTNVCPGSSNPLVVTVNPNPSAAINVSGPTSFCKGGSVTLSASESGASYSWSNGSNSSSITVSNSGNFTLTLTKNGCTSVSSPVSVTEFANPQPVLNLTGSNILCAGESSSITTDAYAAYLWSTGETSAAINVSSSGAYSVSVTDLNGCSGSSEAVDVYVRALPLVDAGADVAFCPDGSTELSASVYAADLFISEYVEGSSNNKYIEIYNGTAANINLGDYRLRNYSNGNTVPNFDNLLSGTIAPGQTVVYKNSAAVTYGGSATSLSSVVFNGNDALVLYKISTNSNVDIIGRIGDDPGSAWISGAHSTLNKTLRRKAGVYGGVGVNPTGTGTAAFTTLSADWDVYATDDVSDLGSHTMSASFTWSPATGLSATSGANVTASPTSTTLYTVSAAMACTSSDQVLVTVYESPLASLSISPILCYGGTAEVVVTATGGTEPYTGTGTFTVTAGNYTFPVTDANGCTNTPSALILEPAELLISSAVSEILCNGGTGSVTISASGGTAPYTGTGSFNLGAGTHTLIVTDANGCTASSTVTLNEPAALSAAIGSLSTSSVNTCAFGTDANIVIGYGGGATSTTLNGSAVGGTGAYSYSWSPASGLSNANVANPVFTPALNSGCNEYGFTLTVTDANGCSATASTSVKVVNVLAPIGSNPKAPRKVLVCHRTHGSNESVNIEVSENAVAAHLAHGDCLGSCNTSCGSDKMFISELISGDAHEAHEELSVYPNPTSGSFTIELNHADLNSKLSIKVIDLSGKEIYSHQGDASAESIQHTVDLNAVSGDLQSGLYLVQVMNGNQIYVSKLNLINKD